MNEKSIGDLLDILKDMHKKYEQLFELGVECSFIDEHADKIREVIFNEVELPEDNLDVPEDDETHFDREFWHISITDYCFGQIEKEVALDELINWKDFIE